MTLPPQPGPRPERRVAPWPPEVAGAGAGQEAGGGARPARTRPACGPLLPVHAEEAHHHGLQGPLR